MSIWVIMYLFSELLFLSQDSIRFVRESVKEVITSMDSNLTCSLLKLLDCFFQPFIPQEVRKLKCYFWLNCS